MKKEEWTYNGRRCKIVRDQELGHYCGYIQTGLRGHITKYENKLFRLIDVNGGLTYGIDENGWVGFDTAHAYDVSVDEDGEVLREDMVYDKNSEDSIIWTPEKVKEEVESLADQFEALENTVHEVE